MTDANDNIDVSGGGDDAEEEKIFEPSKVLSNKPTSLI